MSNQKNQFAEAALIEAARHFGLEIDSKESASVLIELVDLCKEKGMDVGLRDLAALRVVNSIQRPTTESQEREFEEEATESEITPAGPLREMPKNGEKVYYAPAGNGKVYEQGFRQIFQHFMHMFEAGRIFPYTEAGKLGAERRAEQGILPPIDREELRDKFESWAGSLIVYGASGSDRRFLEYLESILEGGHQNE